MEDFVKNLVKENAIVIFSKSWCPYWQDAISILENTGVDFLIYDVESEKDGSKVYAALKKIVKRTTVPQTFIGGKHVGGCDDLTDELEEGKLAKRLDDLGLTHKL